MPNHIYEETFMHQNQEEARGHACAVLVFSPEGIPLVRDLGKVPSFWKFPGGKKKGNETPEQTITRELLEEIGIRVSGESLVLVEKEDRGNHDFYVFRTEVADLAALARRGDEDEKVRVFSPEMVLQLNEQGRFLLSHWFAEVERTIIMNL
jgi:8-oxo-dGTP pyrophosphatase MutT (NUDIX family)